jgi:mannose/cellobiose epimerase-like protein (N-acyl-D-glucosamine 2-epimerase family)
MNDVASRAAALKRWLFDEALPLWWFAGEIGDCLGCLDPIAAG